MKNEFVLAFNEVLEDKQLPEEVIAEALEAAMVSAYRRAVNASNAQLVEAKIDLETGKVLIYAEKEIVDQVQDERTEVTLEEALKEDENAEMGGMVVVETTPRNFGRVAAQTARQVIQQRIREAEREAQLAHFSKQLGEIVSGVVQAVNSQAITLGLDMKAEGIMPRNQQIPGERFRVHDRVRTLLAEVKSSARGPQIILSRAHRNFLRRLLENEVPEIYQGMVEVRSIAREPGQRSKVAVSALQPGVDPVGACVGVRGVRIQAIVRELNDEKIDVIEWNPDPSIYIAKALSPARVTGVYLNEMSRGTKTATVVVPEDQLSLAIGRDGQNARLAAKLTAWRIDIKSLPEAAGDALHKLQSNEEFESILAEQSAVIPQVEATLAKKAEGRPVMPEEYQVLAQFVDTVEAGAHRLRQIAKKEEEERHRIASAEIPDEAYTIPLEELGISPRITTVLGGHGYTTVGDLMLQLNLDSDVILAINGIGPKTMLDIEEALAALEFEAPEEEIAVEAEPEAVVEEAAEELAPTDQVEAVEEEVLEPEPAVEVDAEEEAEAEAVGEEIDVPGEGEVEPEAEPVVAEVAEVETGVEADAQETEEEEEESLEELFSLPESFEFVLASDDDDDEDEEGDDDEKRRRKKKRRRKYVEVEYDPDQDVVLYHRKRKRENEEEWEDDWGG